MYTTLTNYIAKLADLMAAINVTDGNGKTVQLDQGAERSIEFLLDVKAKEKKVMLAGNGGSSAIVSHVQNDLFKRAGIKSLVFTEQPLLTALANDEGYDSVFEWPINMWGDSGDLTILVSSSGRSKNILRAAEASVNKGCNLITFSGFDEDNPLRKMGTINFYVSSHSYGYVENAHAAATHFLTDRAMILEHPGCEVEV